MRLLLVTITLLTALGARAQSSMRSVLTNMPDTIIPYLTANSRLDFIDFIDSGMKAEATNELNGKSRLLRLTDRFASLSLNESSAVDLCLLDLSSPIDSVTQVVCAVWTFGDDIRESDIRFYTPAWLPLRTNDFMQQLSYPMYTATLSDEAQLVVQPSSALEAPANEEQTTTEKEAITLKWDGKIFN